MTQPFTQPPGLRKKILITGGGTGGHVYPALALAEGFQLRNIDVIYVGSQQGLESKLVPPLGIPTYWVTSGPLKNQSVTRRLRTAVQLIQGFYQAFQTLRATRPDAVVGVGGYVSVPTAIAAFCLGIPLYLQEQNTSVGIANRWLGRLARRIFLGFSAAETAFSRKKCVVTGNPIRSRFFDPPIPPAPHTARRLLVMGGSQGARAINEAMVACVEAWQGTGPFDFIHHQTGPSQEQWVSDAYRRLLPQNRFLVESFVDPVTSAYAAASCIVCRSGALTVSELLITQRPCVLIPFPRRGQNDQTANAAMLERMGVGTVVLQGPNLESRLQQALEEISQPDKFQKYQAAFPPLTAPYGTDRICQEILKDWEKE